MPRLGGRKLYYKLQVELSELNVGRDKLFRILKGQPYADTAQEELSYNNRLPP
jgi:hypothetical protein